MKQRFLVLALLAVIFAAVAAHASPINIVLTQAGYHQYQQTTNAPCIFGASSGTCNGFSNQTGGKTGDKAPPAYTLTAEYTVAQLQTLLGGKDAFAIGYDVNQTSDPQELGGFSIAVVNGAVLYSLPSAVGVPDVANGTGYADYLMTAAGGNYFSLAGLDPSATIKFSYTMNTANDGGEQVWLIAKSDPSPVPEPASLLLFGTSLLGVLPLARFRKK